VLTPTRRTCNIGVLAAIRGSKETGRCVLLEGRVSDPPAGHIEKLIENSGFERMSGLIVSPGHYVPGRALLREHEFNKT